MMQDQSQGKVRATVLVSVNGNTDSKAQTSMKQTSKKNQNTDSGENFDEQSASELKPGRKLVDGNWVSHL